MQIVSTFSLLLISIGLLRNIVVAIDIQCSFQNDDFDSIVNQYTCQVQVNLMITTKNVEINEIRGSLGSSKSLNDVVGLSIRDKKIQYMPKNLSDKFKNLIAIRVRQGRLKEVTQADFKSLPKLRYINMDANDIEALDGDIFEFNPQLEVIWFESNKIRSIGVTTFDVLQKLRDLDLNSNACVSRRASSRTEVNALVPKIKQTCSNPEAELKRLKIKFTEVTQKNEELSRDVNKLKIEVSEGQGEVKELRETIEDLTNKKTQSDAKFAEVTIKIKQKEEELEDMKAQLLEKTAQHQLVLDDFKEVEERVKSFQNASLDKERALQDMINDLQNQLHVKDLQLLNLDAELHKYQIISNQTFTELQDMRKVHENGRDLELELRKNVTELQERLEMREIDYENVTDILVNSSMKIKSYEEEINVFKSKVDESELKIVQLSAEQQQLRNISAIKQQLEVNLKNLTEKLKKSEEDLKELIAVNAEISEELTNQTQIAEALTKGAGHEESNEKVYIGIGIAVIALLTIVNVIVALKFYRKTSIIIRPVEVEDENSYGM